MLTCSTCMFVFVCGGSVGYGGGGGFVCGCGSGVDGGSSSSSNNTVIIIISLSIRYHVTRKQTTFYLVSLFHFHWSHGIFFASTAITRPIYHEVR